MNPGQSVKDRAALFIIQDAVKRGELRPGGVIVEGTAGNTGIGLALVGNALGFRSVIVIPETQSQEKKDTLRLCGAELIEVPAVAYSNPEQLRESLRPFGRAACQDREEWRDLGQSIRQRRQPAGPYRNHRTGNLVTDRWQGRWLCLRCRHRRHACRRGDGAQGRNPAVRIALADPMGAALYSYYTTGVLKSEGSSITEGIGQGRITGKSRRRPDRYRLSDSRCRGGADHLRFARARRPLPRRLFGDQCRGCGSACPRAWPGTYHRDHAGRLRHALSIEAVQSGVLARKEPSGTGLAGAQIDIKYRTNELAPPAGVNDRPAAGLQPH